MEAENQHQNLRLTNILLNSGYIGPVEDEQAAERILRQLVRTVVEAPPPPAPTSEDSQVFLNFRAGGGAPATRHSSFEAAREEAGRICLKHRAPVLVLKLVGTVDLVAQTGFKPYGSAK